MEAAPFLGWLRALAQVFEVALLLGSEKDLGPGIRVAFVEEEGTGTAAPFRRNAAARDWRYGS